MSDILEDQKIHYIVKDYQRMFKQHDELIATIKDLKEQVRHRDNRIVNLERQVAILSKPMQAFSIPPKTVKGYLNDMTSKSKSLIASFDKHIKTLNSIVGSLEHLKTSIDIQIEET